MPGAEVGLFTNFQRIGGGKTDERGHWTGRVPAEMKGWAINAVKSGVGFDYAVSERARGSLLKPLPLPDEVRLTLEGACALRVKTVNRNGKPVAGVKLGPWFIQKPGHEADSNPAPTSDFWPVSGADGIAVIDWMPKKFVGSVGINIHSDDFFTADHATWIAADMPIEELTLVLDPKEKLGGRVTLSDGKPAEGVLVAVSGNGAGNNAFRGGTRTGADGRYSLRVNSEQAYIITATKEGLAAPYRANVVVRRGSRSKVSTWYSVPRRSCAAGSMSARTIVLFRVPTSPWSSTRGRSPRSSAARTTIPITTCR